MTCPPTLPARSCPRWLCCACRVLWQLRVLAVPIAVLVGGRAPGAPRIVDRVPVSSLHALHFLITGRTPRSGLAMSVRMLGIAPQVRDCN